VEVLEDNKIYSYGTSARLEEYFKLKLNKKKLKCAFFGDQYVGDVYGPTVNKNWHSFAIVEEMAYLMDKSQLHFDPELPTENEIWGDYFFDEQGEKQNYYLQKACEYATFAFPFLYMLKHAVD